MATDTLHPPAPRQQSDAGAGPSEGERANFAAAWDARFKYHISPKIERQSNGKYTFRRIPIFELHQREDINCNDRWMYGCVAEQKALKAKGYLPRLIIGHNSDNPRDDEKPARASLDNYDYSASDGLLYADYVDVPEDLKKELESNKWPGRSAEASRQKPAIEVVALLGGTPPYFKLPDLKYSDGTDSKTLIFSEIHMATPAKSMIRQLYEDISEMGKPPENPTAPTTGNVEDEQFKKFCDLMKRFMAKALAEEVATDKPAAYAAESAAESEEDKKRKEQEETAKMSAQASGELTVKYHELESRTKASEARVASLVERVDKAEADKVALEDKLERQDWTAKYQQARIPKDRLDVPANVDLLMGVAKEHRQKYYDQSIKNIATPSLTPVKPEAPGAPILAGSEEEAAAIRTYYEANKEKLKYDFPAAQRAYRAEKGIRYN